MINDKLLFEQYEWLVPTQPVSFSKVIEEIVKKFDAQTMESSEIPNIWMHQFNAVHLPKNEDLQLTSDRLQIHAIKIVVRDSWGPYTKKDFRPLLCEDGRTYIYLAYEENTEYCYSNSNRLFLEVKLMQGISQKDIDMRNEEYMTFISYLKSYNELYRNS